MSSYKNHGFEILWPERREVCCDEMSAWYDDAVADGKMPALTFNRFSYAHQAEALHAAGLITLRRP